MTPGPYEKLHELMNVTKKRKTAFVAEAAKNSYVSELTIIRFMKSPSRLGNPNSRKLVCEYCDRELLKLLGSFFPKKVDTLHSLANKRWDSLNGENDVFRSELQLLYLPAANLLLEEDHEADQPLADSESGVRLEIIRAYWLRGNIYKYLSTLSTMDVEANRYRDHAEIDYLKAGLRLLEYKEVYPSHQADGEHVKLLFTLLSLVQIGLSRDERVAKVKDVQAKTGFLEIALQYGERELYNAVLHRNCLNLAGLIGDLPNGRVFLQRLKDIHTDCLKPGFSPWQDLPPLVGGWVEGRYLEPDHDCAELVGQLVNTYTWS
jgi:hypothetical protein